MDQLTQCSGHNELSPSPPLMPASLLRVASKSRAKGDLEVTHLRQMWAGTTPEAASSPPTQMPLPFVTAGSFLTTGARKLFPSGNCLGPPLYLSWLSPLGIRGTHTQPPVPPDCEPLALGNASHRSILYARSTQHHGCWLEGTFSPIAGFRAQCEKPQHCSSGISELKGPLKVT